MNNFLVIDDTHGWLPDIAGSTMVQARNYLTDLACGVSSADRVFNLCRSCRYQSQGYYVSLLAEARGQQPFPHIGIIADLQSPAQIDWLNESLGALIQRELAPIKGNKLELSIFFGCSVVKRYARLGLQLYGLMRIPLLHARFEHKAGQWQLVEALPLAIGEIPLYQRDFLIGAAQNFFAEHKPPVHHHALRFHLAILHNPDDPEPPSNTRAIQKFRRAAETLGMRAHLITRTDYARLDKFDALFIRDTTFANHYTYHFSRRAEALGMAVIDDADSILRCNNKVYLAELFAMHHLPVPKTMLVHKDNIDQVVYNLALPCVLKQPDSSFSLGVVKVDTPEQLRGKAGELLEKSELIIAQEYLPTEFDWRVIVLNRKILCVAKYYMAPGHWQIIKHDAQAGGYIEGSAVAVAETDAPREMLRLALQAANLIGDGFYGVDIKQSGERYYFIEINDNPSLDAGNEDALLKDALYRKVMNVFLQRIKARRR